MGLNETEEKLLEELRHNMRGWQTKATETFSDEAFLHELAQLESDDVYSSFGFANYEYVLIRSMGRISISIGRRLGELYDKVPRLAVKLRFSLTDEEVAPKMGPEGGTKLNLDIGLPYRPLSEDDHEHIDSIGERFNVPQMPNGYGMEIRYNFNPNDSSRLRKDVTMAQYLAEAGLSPVYLVFSSISPRDEAIRRLTRAGWKFLIGEDASSYMYELCGLDVASILEKPEIASEIETEIDKMYECIFLSDGFKRATEKWLPRIEYHVVPF